MFGFMEATSELGMMAGRESFGLSMQNSPVKSQPTMQSMRLAYAPDGTAIYKPITSNSSPPPGYQGGGGPGGGGGVSTGATDGTSPPVPTHGLNINAGEPVKRKRGRPRKYGPDGTMALALAPASSAARGGFSPPSGAANAVTSAPANPTKKARGRPPGSRKKLQMAALGSAGIGFTPHIITVKTGEDVSSKIMSFSQNGRRAICILSTNGAISKVTLRQAASFGGCVTYEGRFEILSLSGSFLLTESGGQHSQTGGLSVSLADPNGRVLGGGVAGLLTAASPVQVVVGSFIPAGKRELKQNSNNPDSRKLGPGGLTGAGSPTSQGTMSESSGGGPGSPLNHGTGTFNNNNQQGFSSIPWK